MNYIVTTDKESLPSTRIAMVDGTVPGWKPRPGDLHFDHHRPGGGKVQIDEIPQAGLCAQEEWVFATTQVDADACVAAAWLQLPPQVAATAHDKLRAIALDCDYLGVFEPELSHLAEFAAKAVAALKEASTAIAENLGLPSDRKAWGVEGKQLFASACFQSGTEWLIDAANGKRLWPGEWGEADRYFARLVQDTEDVRAIAILVNGVAYLDQASLGRYIDPRCLVSVAKELGVDQPVTLTSRAMPRGRSYTLGSLPWHPAIAQLDLTKIFPKLAKAEAAKRESLGLPPAETTWGGRATVGGSGWRDASVLSPDEVTAIAISGLG